MELTRQWQSSTQAISYALQISIRGAQLALPSPVVRNHQKILKPQFFQAFKDEKRNIELMDTAAAYLAKKGAAASVAMAEIDTITWKGEYADEAPALGIWGGVVSRNVLSCEVVPMLVKMQGLTTSTSFSRTYLRPICSTHGPIPHQYSAS